MTRNYTWDDLMMPDVVVDPYPFFAQMRAQSPARVVRSSSQPTSMSEAMWPLLRYDDAYAALADHDTFSSEPKARGGDGNFKIVLLSDDPPRHTRFRKLVSKTFTPRRIAHSEGWIRETSNELFDALGTGQVEAVWDYTVPLPVKAIAKLLGIPGSEYATFKRWTDALLSSSPTEEAGARRMQSIMEMSGYFAQMAALRRAEPMEDLISLLVAGDADGGKLEDWEVVGFAMLLLIAGNETTTNLMSNSLNFLATRPDIFAKLHADRALIEPFIEEMLRYESPVQVLFRETAKEAHLPSGAVIPAGEPVGVFYGSANRDPDEWDAPDEFQLDRNLKDHVAFGHGIHYCLGSPLARMEARVTLQNLLGRFREVRPGAEPARRQSAASIVLGFDRLPLELAP